VIASGLMQRGNRRWRSAVATSGVWILVLTGTAVATHVIVLNADYGFPQLAFGALFYGVGLSVIVRAALRTSPEAA